MNLRRFLSLVVCALLAPLAARAQTTATLFSNTTTLNPAGGQVTFTFGATFTGTAVFGLTVNIPAGWSYASGTGEPPIKPSVGQTGSLDWAVLNPATDSASFSFTVSYPAGATGPAVSVTSSSIFRPTTGPSATIIPAPIVFASAPVITTQPTSQTIAAGANATLNVVVSGTAPLAYQWRKDGTTLAGATSASLALTNFQAANAGAYSVVVSNGVGTATSQNATLTLAPSSGNGGGGGGTPPVAPSLTTQPANVTVIAGATATFSVVASGTSPLTYQWRKGNTAISGATAATLTLAAVVATDEDVYSVVVANAVGSVTSNAAALTVRLPPSFSLPPVAVTVDEGQPASFSVSVSGTNPLTYQWRKGGTAIAGATSSTLSFLRASAADAGTYSIVVTNPFGSITSSGVELTVRPPVTPVGFAGSYFGTFGNGGSFALYVRADRSATFLGYATNASATFVVPAVVVDAAGHFRFTVAGTAASSSADRPVAAAGDYTVDATISSTGALTGTVSGLTSLSATRSAATGSTQSLAGFYQAGAINSSATSYAIVSPAGQAFVLTVMPTATDAGTGTVDATGRLAVTTSSSATVTGTLTAATSTLTASVTTSGGAKTDFVGGSETRASAEKLFNIATRGPIGNQSGEMIAGFVIRGDTPKTVLIRAVGPGLAAFGLTTAVSTPRLELFRDSTSLAVNTGWGAVTDIIAAAARVGAFALTPNSKDAVLLVSLTPGAYTAVVSGDNGASGVALVEVYDASGSSAPSQKIVNIASRGTAGGGDSTLTAGFVIDGTVPKRVLIRGIGPTLGGFGVPGTLADPQLKLFDQPGAVVATNEDWGTPATATAATAAQISAAAAAVGAFALAPGSKDAALLLYLAPGPYTAQLGSAGTATGAALIEVYEVP